MERGRRDPRTLEELLDRIHKASEDAEKVSLDDILDEVGRRSFGPVLLLAGIVTVMPVVGDIPGVPTAMGILVLLAVGQLVFGRDHFWLPNWLLKRSISHEKIEKGLKWMRKPARFVDRIIRHRLEAIATGAGVYVMAVACLVIALAMPLMEFVPFSANGAGAALTLFGLAFIARDGLVGLIALILTGGTFFLVAYNLL